MANGDLLGLHSNIFSDGFESGDTSAWTIAVSNSPSRWDTTESTSDLAVTQAAALAGTAFGLQITVDDLSPDYVQTSFTDPAVSPQGPGRPWFGLAEPQPSSSAGLSRVRARVYIHPNGVDPGEAQQHRRLRFLLLNDEASKRVVALVLRRVGGSYSIGARIRVDGGGRLATAFVPITNAAHFVEFDWQRSTGANDGRFELWIDGTSVETMTGIDNDTMSVGSARIGGMSPKGGVSGALLLDEYVMRVVSYIGPVGG
jgi:hypothetical protein